MRRVFHFMAGLPQRSSARWSDGVELRAMALRALELRALERQCLEQARLCRLPESRAALEEIARNYREAINRFALSTVSPG
jgi:hypothetical protein